MAVVVVVVVGISRAEGGGLVSFECAAREICCRSLLLCV